MQDPYASETRDESRQRRVDDFAAWQAETARAAMLASADAATLRGLLADHVARRHDEWRQELDTLARAYVAALDREAAQLPLKLAGVAR